MNDSEMNVDSNEEFICGYCMKELVGRYLFCSEECEEKLYNEDNVRKIE